MGKRRIAVFGGTTEGRQVAEGLAGIGVQVVLHVTTDTGARHFLRNRCGNQDGHPAGFVEIVTGALDATAMRESLAATAAVAVIDATHPFAEEVSRHIRAAAIGLSVPSIIVKREDTRLPEEAMIHVARDYAEAAEAAQGLGERVFLAIGSRRLPDFVGAFRGNIDRLTVRVLSDTEALEMCARVGIESANVLAATGPFTHEFNKACLAFYRSDVLIAKDSGPSGGTAEKVSACSSLGLPVVLIKRPEIAGAHVTDVSEAVDWGRAIFYGS